MLKMPCRSIIVMTSSWRRLLRAERQGNPPERIKRHERVRKNKADLFATQASPVPFAKIAATALRQPFMGRNSACGVVVPVGQGSSQNEVSCWTNVRGHISILDRMAPGTTSGVGPYRPNKLPTAGVHKTHDQPPGGSSRPVCSVVEPRRAWREGANRSMIDRACL
jgi:hypothetical protein